MHEELRTSVEVARSSWVFLIFAMWGGAAHYISGLRAGNRPFSIFELLGDLVISGFSGMLAYALCAHLALGDWLTAAAVGVSGHLGSRSVFIIEQYLKRRLRLMVEKSTDD